MSGLERLKSDPRVEIIDDERALGNSLIVTLARGWRFDDDGCHVFGEDTVAAALRSMRRCRPCSCQGCNGPT